MRERVEETGLLFEEKKSSFAFRSLAFFILISGIIFSTAIVIPKTWSPVFEPFPEHINVATIPSSAPRNIEALTPAGPAKTESGEGRISIERWDTEHRALRVELSEPDRLHIRTFNFPGWTATVNGRSSEIITGRERSEIVIDLPAGDHRVMLDYLDTPPRRAARITTITSFSLLMAMLFAGLGISMLRPAA